MTKNSPLSALLKALSTWTEANETETIIDRKRDCVTLKMASPDQKTIQQIKTAAQRQKRPFSLRFENGHTLIEIRKKTGRDLESKQLSFLKRKHNDDQFYSLRPPRY